MSQSPASPAASDDREAQETPRILLVDDISIIRDIARVLLTKAGFEVDMAADGAEAVDLAATRRYALILMDVNMPTIDGIQATSMIRDLGAPNGTVPIVAMTAEKAAPRIQSILEAGMDGHLCKPFGRTELLDAVRAWIH